MSTRLSFCMCAKIDDGSIRSALQILLSEDKPAEDNDATYNELIARHPSAPTNGQTPVKPESLGNYPQVNEDDVKKAIRSFAQGSSGGPYGLCLHHIIDLLFFNDSDPALLSAITAFINMLVRGHTLSISGNPSVFWR